MSLEIKPFDDRKVKSLIQRIKGSEDAIIKAGAEITLAQIKKDIFVDKGTARDKVVIGKSHKNEKGETIIKIGWPEGSKVEYRVHFVEWGTVHQKPQLKITKAVKDSHEKRLNAMHTVMRKEYGLNG
ncbi:hypothetical protein ERX35_007855 [Macrococcus equipercicus]|uniref:HK97 gp10 family phage protein n=1 Tax=Macrococcus equipercicus TaxID=69967 RepID=A0ABQ6R7P5_9STAP|nr:HK97-gp10 family putative phage morphogenesis protein [Macrococcus equipercicus]KAA1039121.1 hypothetical protein ERX35_007855 [Macrococcus equipercicus]